MYKETDSSIVVASKGLGAQVDDGKLF